MLRTLAVIVLAAVVPFSLASAQETEEPATEVTALDAQRVSDLGADLKAFDRMAEFCDNLDPCAAVIRRVADENLEMLREPRGDGSYRWANLQRIEAGRRSSDGEIVKVHSEAELDTIAVAGQRIYSAIISVPKRRTMFSSNNKVWVRDLVVESEMVDGRTRTYEIPVGEWIEPEDSRTVPLEDVALKARVVARLGVQTGNTKSAAEVTILEASLVDDPRNPYYPFVRQFKGIGEVVAARRPDRSQLRTLTREAVLNLPGEMERLVALREERLETMRREERGEDEGIVVGDATPDVVHEMQKAATLLAGTATEQQEGRAKLEKLIEKLLPPPAEPEGSGE